MLLGQKGGEKGGGGGERNDVHCDLLEKKTTLDRKRGGGKK